MIIFRGYFLGAHSGWPVSFWAWMRRCKFFLKLKTNIVQNILLTTLSSLLIITCKVCSSFLTWSLILHLLWVSSVCTYFSYHFYSWKKGLFSISPLGMTFVGSAKYLTFIYIYIYIYIYINIYINDFLMCSFYGF